MSVWVSQVHKDGVHLHTDAGFWNNDGTLADIRQKAWFSKTGLVVTMIGGAPWRSCIPEDLCEMADDLGVAETFTRLQAYSCMVRAEYGIQRNWRHAVQVLVAGYVPGKGGVHRWFSSYNGRPQIDAYRVYTPIPVYHQGPKRNDYSPASLGLAQHPGEPDDAWRRRQGLALVEHMRTVKDGHPCGKMGYFVGGRCDLTTIAAAGVKQETVKEWPEDQVGLPVDPFGEVDHGPGVEAVAA